jgi:hypothetical protein
MVGCFAADSIDWFVGIGCFAVDQHFVELCQSQSWGFRAEVALIRAKTASRH